MTLADGFRYRPPSSEQQSAFLPPARHSGRRVRVIDGWCCLHWDVLACSQLVEAAGIGIYGNVYHLYIFAAQFLQISGWLMR